MTDPSSDTSETPEVPDPPVMPGGLSMPSYGAGGIGTGGSSSEFNLDLSKPMEIKPLFDTNALLSPLDKKIATDSPLDLQPVEPLTDPSTDSLLSAPSPAVTDFAPSIEILSNPEHLDGIDTSPPITPPPSVFPTVTPPDVDNPAPNAPLLPDVEDYIHAAPPLPAVDDYLGGQAPLPDTDDLLSSRPPLPDIDDYLPSPPPINDILADVDSTLPTDFDGKPLPPPSFDWVSLEEQGGNVLSDWKPGDTTRRRTTSSSNQIDPKLVKFIRPALILGMLAFFLLSSGTSLIVSLFGGSSKSPPPITPANAPIPAPQPTLDSSNNNPPANGTDTTVTGYVWTATKALGDVLVTNTYPGDVSTLIINSTPPDFINAHPTWWNYNALPTSTDPSGTYTMTICTEVPLTGSIVIGIADPALPSHAQTTVIENTPTGCQGYYPITLDGHNYQWTPAEAYPVVTDPTFSPESPPTVEVTEKPSVALTGTKEGAAVDRNALTQLNAASVIIREEVATADSQRLDFNVEKVLKIELGADYLSAHPVMWLETANQTADTYQPVIVLCMSIPETGSSVFTSTDRKDGVSGIATIDMMPYGCEGTYFNLDSYEGNSLYEWDPSIATSTAYNG